MDELSALSALVRAADGRATPEPVIGLAIAVISPWAGDRRDIRDQPNKPAPSTADGLISFLRKVRPELGSPLPVETGWLGWLQYSGLATPLADIRTCPAWIRNPALAGGWVALPPLGGFQELTDTVRNDGRIALLHVLCAQVGLNAPSDAVQVLAEWFVGSTAAEWSHSAAVQCPAMELSRLQQRSWFRSFRAVQPADVVSVVCGSPVAASWARPAPTAAELATRQEREQLRLAIEFNRAAWRKPARVNMSHA
jgi:hypothetical protein